MCILQLETQICYHAMVYDGISQDIPAYTPVRDTKEAAEHRYILL
jgi:hypothetical protein